MNFDTIKKVFLIVIVKEYHVRIVVENTVPQLVYALSICNPVDKRQAGPGGFTTFQYIPVQNHNSIYDQHNSLSIPQRYP